MRSHGWRKRRTWPREAAPVWVAMSSKTPPASGEGSCSGSPTSSSLASARAHIAAMASMVWREAMPASSKMTRAPGAMA